MIRSVTMRLVAKHSWRLGFVPSSHHAEYLAFLKGLELATARGATGILARSDALRMVRHVNREEIGGGEGIEELGRKTADLSAEFARSS